MRIIADKTSWRAIALTLGVFAGACRDAKPLLPTEPSPIAESGMVASLRVSDASPSVGSVIVVSIEVKRPSESARLASFMSRVTYDQTAMEVVETTAVDGMMTAINAQPGLIIAAGASATGIEGPRLYSVKFRALTSGASGVSSLSLSLSELNDAAYRNQAATLRVMNAPLVDRRMR